MDSKELTHMNGYLQRINEKRNEVVLINVSVSKLRRLGYLSLDDQQKIRDIMKKAESSMMQDVQLVKKNINKLYEVSDVS